MVWVGIERVAFIGPGGPEFLLVMLVLIMMFGAKDAPRILRKLNSIFNQIRDAADGFKREVMYGDVNVKPVILPGSKPADDTADEPEEDDVEEPEHDSADEHEIEHGEELEGESESRKSDVQET